MRVMGASLFVTQRAGDGDTDFLQDADGASLAVLIHFETPFAGALTGADDPATPALLMAHEAPQRAGSAR